MATLDWSPIANCPGRFVLGPQHAGVAPGRLAEGATASRRLRSPHAADPIELVMLDDGAILSYRKSDGRYVHTLNTFEGLARKLAQLEAVDDVASP